MKRFNTSFNISVITKIETLGYTDVAEKMQLLESFLSTATIYSLNEAVTQKTIELRKVKKMKLGDAIIAATAMVYDLVIITRNLSDFRNLSGVNAIDPHQI